MWTLYDILLRPGTTPTARTPDPVRAEWPAVAILTLPRIGTDDLGGLEEAVSTLPVSLHADERQACMDWMHPGSRLAHLAGRSLLRWTLAHTTGLPAASWRVRRAPDGAPHAEGPTSAPPLYVSIAHTDGAASAAVAERPVGIDLEPLDRPIVWDRLARRVFADEAERSRIGALAPPERDHALRTRWVVLEASAKATRLGLARLLHLRPAVSRTRTGWEVLVPSGVSTRVRVQTARLQPEGMLLALAMLDAPEAAGR